MYSRANAVHNTTCSTTPQCFTNYTVLSRVDNFGLMLSHILAGAVPVVTLLHNNIIHVI